MTAEFGPGCAASADAAANVPSPRFSSTFSCFEPGSTATTSRRPSPFRSADAAKMGSFVAPAGLPLVHATEAARVITTAVESVRFIAPVSVGYGPQGKAEVFRAGLRTSSCQHGAD